MRAKIIDEEVGHWFIFGEYPEGANVDIWCEPLGCDVIFNIPRPIAEAVCKAQEEFRHKIYELLMDSDGSIDLLSKAIRSKKS